MNDVPDSAVSLFFSHYTVILFTQQFSLFRFIESSLGENNLIVLVYL